MNDKLMPLQLMSSISTIIETLPQDYQLRQHSILLLVMIMTTMMNLVKSSASARFPISKHYATTPEVGEQRSSQQSHTFKAILFSKLPSHIEKIRMISLKPLIYSLKLLKK